jgi:sulfur-oxidizing protein SoxA
LKADLHAIPALAVAAALSAAVPQAQAQSEEDTQRGIERYREMLREDPWSNPGLLDADRGEMYWFTAAGPNNVTLEDCDLGLGPGVVEGAFAQLPRFFEDAGRVMDAETRVLWCMETLQGRDMTDFLNRPHPGGGQPVRELGAIGTWIAHLSAGMPFAMDESHPAVQDAVALGQTLFKMRSGPFDFSCETCHAVPGQRIRLQELPWLAGDEAAQVVGEWPAYRVSSTHVMTMQHRLFDCYWQMRMPRLQLGSEASVALTAYLASNAAGGEVAAPGLKR